MISINEFPVDVWVNPLKMTNILRSMGLLAFVSDSKTFEIEVNGSKCYVEKTPMFEQAINNATECIITIDYIKLWKENEKKIIKLVESRNISALALIDEIVRTLKVKDIWVTESGSVSILGREVPYQKELLSQAIGEGLQNKKSEDVSLQYSGLLHGVRELLTKDGVEVSSANMPKLKEVLTQTLPSAKILMSRTALSVNGHRLLLDKNPYFWRELHVACGVGLRIVSILDIYNDIFGAILEPRLLSDKGLSVSNPETSQFLVVSVKEDYINLDYYRNGKAPSIEKDFQDFLNRLIAFVNFKGYKGIKINCVITSALLEGARSCGFTESEEPSKSILSKAPEFEKDYGSFEYNNVPFKKSNKELENLIKTISHDSEVYLVGDVPGIQIHVNNASDESKIKQAARAYKAANKLDSLDLVFYKNYGILDSTEAAKLILSKHPLLREIEKMAMNVEYEDDESISLDGVAYLTTNSHKAQIQAQYPIVGLFRNGKVEWSRIDQKAFKVVKTNHGDIKVLDLLVDEDLTTIYRSLVGIEKVYVEESPYPIAILEDGAKAFYFKKKTTEIRPAVLLGGAK